MNEERILNALIIYELLIKTSLIIPNSRYNKSLLNDYSINESIWYQLNMYIILNRPYSKIWI